MAQKNIGDAKDGILLDHEKMHRVLYENSRDAVMVLTP